MFEIDKSIERNFINYDKQNDEMATRYLHPLHLKSVFPDSYVQICFPSLYSATNDFGYNDSIC